MKAGNVQQMIIKSQNISPHILLISQYVFNTGFYAVIPFLAIFLREELHYTGATIGIIIGLRTFCQQGLFLLGGALTDRMGARTIILFGCLIRILGFLFLATGSSFWSFIPGACLTGIGGALFSPAIESLMARAGTVSEKNGKRNRAEWFALFAVCGELGALTGPLVGTFMMENSFRYMAVCGVIIFSFALILLYFILPDSSHSSIRLQIQPWWTTFRNRQFVIFIVAYSAYMFSYNQLYLALPVELKRSGCPESDIGLLFMLASIMTISLQLPITRYVSRIFAPRILSFGFFLISTAFFCVAMFASIPPPENVLRLLPSMLFVVLLTCGQMIIVPAGMNMVMEFSGGNNLGAHYGALSSMGGIAVLGGNFIFGNLLDYALAPSIHATISWWLMGLVPLCSSLVMLYVCKR